MRLPSGSFHLHQIEVHDWRRSWQSLSHRAGRKDSIDEQVEQAAVFTLTIRVASESVCSSFAMYCMYLSSQVEEMARKLPFGTPADICSRMARPSYTSLSKRLLKLLASSKLVVPVFGAGSASCWQLCAVC